MLSTVSLKKHKLHTEIHLKQYVFIKKYNIHKHIPSKGIQVMTMVNWYLSTYVLYYWNDFFSN